MAHSMQSALELEKHLVDTCSFYTPFLLEAQLQVMTSEKSLPSIPYGINISFIETGT